jgi:hypothetical protein
LEVWKDIVGYEGLYQVSNLGKVRSLNHYDSLGRLRIGVVLKPQFDSRKNYLHVNLNGKSINVHRIVAKAFIDNPNNYNEINHIDEDKTNNCASNLEWCTHRYNNNYGSKLNSTRGVNNPKSKLTDNDILEIRELYKPYSKSNNAKALAKRFGVSHYYIYHIVRNDRWGWV